MGNAEATHNFDVHKDSFTQPLETVHSIPIPLNAPIHTEPQGGPPGSTILYTVDHSTPIATYVPEKRRVMVLFAIAFMAAAGMLQWLSQSANSDILADYFS